MTARIDCANLPLVCQQVDGRLYPKSWFIFTPSQGKHPLWWPRRSTQSRQQLRLPSSHFDLHLHAKDSPTNKTRSRRAPCRHYRDASVYRNTTTVIEEDCNPPPYTKKVVSGWARLFPGPLLKTHTTTEIMLSRLAVALLAYCPSHVNIPTSNVSQHQYRRPDKVQSTTPWRKNWLVTTISDTQTNIRLFVLGSGDCAWRLVLRMLIFAFFSTA